MLKPKLQPAATPVVGIYRLISIAASDNFRASAIQGIMKRMKAKGILIVVRTPELNEASFYHYRVLNDLRTFMQAADLIIANRKAPDLGPVRHKIYTRDLFGSD